MIDSLQTLTLRAVTVAGTALVIQQHFQIVSEFVHDRESIVVCAGPAINYI
jgi:hypothetical protein